MRSITAAAIRSSPNTDPHLLNSRFVVITTDCLSYASADLCQVFGHESSGDYAAIGSSSSSGAVRSKKASMTSAGTLYPMVECGLFRL